MRIVTAAMTKETKTLWCYEILVVIHVLNKYVYLEYQCDERSCQPIVVDIESTNIRN
jgi:hypothetical protein